MRHARRPGGEKASVAVLVWDLPLRVVHWLLVVLFVFSWWSAAQDHLQWHRYSGLVVLTLVLFRIYWGFVGPAYARFKNFIHGPVVVARYAKLLFRRSSEEIIGHNPLGGWSAVLLLALLLSQTLLGLFVVDVDGIESGPLAYMVSFDLGRTAAKFHGRVFDALRIFITLHVAAICFYKFYKRQNLIAAMIHGRRLAAGASAATQFPSVTRWGFALAGILFFSLLVMAVGNGFRW